MVNADDLGLHPRIDDGILRAQREGIVTSATLLSTGTYAAEAVAAARAQRLPLGVHLCLTTGLAPAAPVHQVRSVAPHGRFRPAWSDVVAAWLSRRLPLDEVAREFRAQIERARQLGAEPDHLDGHQHLHVLPGIARVIAAIAREERLPVRWPMGAPNAAWVIHPGAALKTGLIAVLSLAARGAQPGLRGLGTFEAGRLTEDRLLSLLQRLGPGDCELGCHPGEDVGEVTEEPGWRYGWTEELQALCSPRVRNCVAALGIELTSYSRLFQ